ncbi:transcriptional regulator [Pseudomonas sp. NFXW11]|uniref:transcriptional regulator n=1 Tax=Pseudomonas sp. NFXW11 TaxID=2819531 RepID=UPI003CEA7D2C
MSNSPIFVVLLFFGIFFSVNAQESPPSAQVVMSENKEKIKNHLEALNYNRKLMVAENMQLDDQKAESFWPIYSRYRNEIDFTSRAYFKLLFEYARAHASGSGSVTHEDAAGLIKSHKTLVARQRMTLFRYVDEVSRKMSPVTAMRFLQIEEQLDATDVLRLGQQVPLVE